MDTKKRWFHGLAEGRESGPVLWNLAHTQPSEVGPGPRFASFLFVFISVHSWLRFFLGEDLALFTTLAKAGPEPLQHPQHVHCCRATSSGPRGQGPHGRA